MRGADIDDVCITLDTMFYRMKVDLRCLTIGKPRLELPHCYGIVLGIVECEVANLMENFGILVKRDHKKNIPWV
jgi:hypothetical protein